MTAASARFETSVTPEDGLRFAEVSGDWNPLHTDAAHAAASVYGRRVLHGAFSAGLISRLAGMYLPGVDCLLHGMKLKFVSPILPPASLVVSGRVTAESASGGRVEASVVDKATGAVYVEASYEFGRHRMASSSPSEQKTAAPRAGAPVILVTGTSGGLGAATLRRLGTAAIAARRNADTGRLEAADLTGGEDGARPIKAIVHCGWPMPDNRRFIDIEDPDRAIEHGVAHPIRDIQVLASALAKRGLPQAPLILVGSTFAEPGRHYFRMPLYSIAKSTIPTIVEILSLELASTSHRCVGVVFDVLDGGMNKGITDAARLAHADRSPWGALGTMDEAADQIRWLIENESRLLSGATVTLTSGSVP